MISAVTTDRAALAPDHPIATERLLLRSIDPAGDADALHAYLSREEACRYTARTPMTRQQVVARLRNPDLARSVLTEPGQVLALAVVLRETGELIGDAVLTWHNAEICYVINPDHQGRG